MKDKILEQEEIDALIGFGKDEEEDSKRNIKAYDFFQNKITRGNMPALEIVNEKFARKLKIDLFNYLRCNIDISFSGVRVVKYADYSNSLFIPTNVNLLSIEGLNGKGLCVIDAKLIHAMVELFYGGELAVSSRVGCRDFTMGEYQMISSILEILFSNYAAVWDDIINLNFIPIGSEINPAMVNLINPMDIIIVNKFKVELDVGSGEIHIGIPHSLIEPIKEEMEAYIQGKRKQENIDWEQTLTNRIDNVAINLRVELGSCQVPLSKISNIKSGEVIFMDMPKEATVYAEKIPIIKGRFGKHNNKYGVKINRINTMGIREKTK